MDEVILKIVVPLLFPFVGVALSNIKSDDLIKEIRGIIIKCDDILLERLNIQIADSFNELGNKIKWGFNRIIAIQQSKSKNFTLEETEIDINIVTPVIQKSTFYDIKCVLAKIRKLEAAILRITSYKIFFWVLFFSGALFSFLYLFNIYNVNVSGLMVFTAMGLMSILVYLLDRIIISNLIKNISRDYGLS